MSCSVNRTRGWIRKKSIPFTAMRAKTATRLFPREKLYVKLEKGKSYLLYGDYRTDLTETTLAAYTRSFNGLSAVRPVPALFRHAHRPEPVCRYLPGKGFPDTTYLNNNTIIEGSERVVIETRDRLQPDRVLNRVKSNGGLRHLTQ